MMSFCLAEQLGRFCDLSAGERTLLHELEGTSRQVRKGTVLRTERSPSSDIFVVAEGWLCCATLLEDGRRQIIRLHFRGDLLGADMLGLAGAPTTIFALTDGEIHMIEPDAFGRLFQQAPRLAALLYVALQAERVELTDRLTSLGRASARGRVAALLVWIAERLRAADPQFTGRFTLPMTQEEIGDATGLTAVHVNRTLRVLEEQGLIERSRSVLTLRDIDRLAALADHHSRAERVMPGWLPPAG